MKYLEANFGGKIIFDRRLKTWLGIISYTADEENRQCRYLTLLLRQPYDEAYSESESMVVTLTSWLSVALWLATGAFRGRREMCDLPGRFAPGLADMKFIFEQVDGLVGICENSRASIQGMSASHAKDHLAPGISHGEEWDVFGVPFELLRDSLTCSKTYCGA